MNQNLLDNLNLDQFTLTGRPDGLSRHPKYIDFLLGLNVYLSENRDDYVALAPHGSQLKGIALPDSDFDIIIIGGNSKITTDNEFNRMVKEFCTEHFQRDSSVVEIWAPDYFSSNFVQDDHCTSEYSHAAWLLAYPFIGNFSKVDEFRAQAQKRHLGRRQISPAHAASSFERTIDSILLQELGAHKIDNSSRRDDIWKKLLSRGYSESDLVDVFQEREKFWRQRVTLLLEE